MENEAGQFSNVTESQLIKVGQGVVAGVIANSHSSGKFKIYDGVDDTLAAKASGVLTISGGSLTPAKFAETVFTKTGNFLDDVSATGVLTSDNTEVSDGDTVTIGTVTYRFKNTMAQINDVKRDGTTADTTMGNLIKAINGTGTGGVEYYTGTVANPDFTAGSLTSHAFTVTAIVAGTAGNSFAKTETSSHLDWDGVGSVMTGGTNAETITIGSIVYRWKNTLAQAYDIKIGADLATSLDNLKLAINATGTAGTHYYAGTVAHPDVIATDNANTTQMINSRVIGTANNAIATTETCAGGAWEDTTLGGGTGASIAGVATADSTFTIDTQTYYLTTKLSETVLGTAVANEILWVTNDATALDNVKLAVNGTGTEGTNYSTGTNAHTSVTATTNTDTAQTFVSKLYGSRWNEITTTETIVHASFASTTLTGGDNGGRLMVSEYTLPTGSSVVTFPKPINFINGLFLVISSGTADLTPIYK